ncbi:MAG: response regulator receiver protein [Chitinophagaceae bacterium]|nr:response regulator receiver protein [Chitinophagaceae bacterium]
MSTSTILGKNIFIADDDNDDLILFQDALREICKDSLLTTAKDGQQLMKILDETVPPSPDVIFLDLNMPRKNGFECLDEIRLSEKLKNIPIVIFSTSDQPEAINKVYEQGASHFLTKPSSFPLLKQAIQKVLAINWQENLTQPSKEKFIIHI